MLEILRAIKQGNVSPSDNAAKASKRVNVKVTSVEEVEGKDTDITNSGAR